MTGRPFIALAIRKRPRALQTAMAALALLLLLAGAPPALADAAAGCEPRPVAYKIDATRPINLGELKSELLSYRCTRYDHELALVAGKARAWLEHRAGHVAKPALVLDIDETSLSNWAEIYHNDFAYIRDGDCDLSSARACGVKAWELGASAVAIVPTLELFKAAEARHVAVFFITGRREALDGRAATEANLHKAGYDSWVRLYMRPQDSHEPSVAPFKTQSRIDIEKQGYTIIANMGDQASDLAGGHAERAFKFPDPFYYIP
jgi:HAD superfamily, subfamily IIIB (Acid phosphatase)